MNLKKIGKGLTSKFVVTGPSSYEKKNLPSCGLTKVEKHCLNPLNPELNPICYLLALLGAQHFLHISKIRVNNLVIFYTVFQLLYFHD